jgi:putative FmdB family regulatory protein
MPLYEYACDACGGRFEIIQKFSEVSEQCRTCGKGPVHRLQSAPGIQFKGTGWYVTDYAQKGRSGDESSGKGSGGEKADTKTSDGGSSDSSTKSETTKSESTKSESSKSESTASAATSTGKDSKS